MLSREDVKEIVDEALILAFGEHEKREAESLKNTIKELLLSLVPEGDPAPHRAYHQAKVEAAKAAKEAEDAKRKLYEYLFRILTEKTAEGLVRVIRILFWIAVIAGLAKLGIVLPSWAEKLL